MTPLLNPHGSDETEYGSIFQGESTLLLNPHGSDETAIKIEILRVNYSFLTHTVQMKLFFLAFYLTPSVFFLTHTVQMKPEITTPNII